MLQDSTISVPPFLIGGGHAARLILRHDWASSPLGPMEHWPQSLRTALGMALTSLFPTYLVWGPSMTSFYNDAYRPMLGTKPEALGRPFREVWPETWETVGPIARRALAGEASYFEDMNLTLERHGNPEQTWFTFCYSPIRDESGECRGVLCTVQETTQRKLAELALARLNETLERRVVEATAERQHAEEALRQSQKMDSVGQLTGGLAHDFNNLLTGIQGSLDLLKLNLAERRFDQVERHADAAMATVQRAGALTQRLLGFARRQPLHPRPVHVERQIAAMGELLRRTLGRAVAVSIRPQPNLWPVLCDPHQLENAVLNLAINARDAMPQGGAITIDMTNCEIGPDGGAAGAYVAIRVSDTGRGMPAEVVERVFEPFFTTKPPGQGTGLGLSMIYGFVQQSDGRIRIDSEPGHGTAVTLWLPRSAAPHD